MEIRTLRYFLAVAREENMTKAAETLHVTQPTLSKALKSLEEELGKKLFTRHSFSIRLTEEGVLLRNRAEDLVSMADRIEREYNGSHKSDHGLGKIWDWRSPIKSVFSPARSIRLSNPIPAFAITSPAETQSRSQRSWIRDYWISLYWPKYQMPKSTNLLFSRKLTFGDLSCQRRISWQ